MAAPKAEQAPGCGAEPACFAAAAASFEAFRAVKPRSVLKRVPRAALNPCAALSKAEDAPAADAPPAPQPARKRAADGADPPLRRVRAAASTSATRRAPLPPSPFAVHCEPVTLPCAPPAALASLPPPFVAPPPGAWRERYAACCPACFATSAVCVHHPERPLRLLLCGHNPSEHAWASGFPYSNPTNRFWRLMALGGLVPPGFTARDADAAPALLGLGITDLGCAPGSDAAAFKRPTLRAWRAELYARMVAHCRRAQAWAAAAAASEAGAERSFGAHLGTDDDEDGHNFADADVALRLYAPRVLAFAGKRQWGSLFDPPLAKVTAGLQPRACRPPGWPFTGGDDVAELPEVWVLPSSSGRAVMTAQEREGPYRALGERIAQIAWPLEPVPRQRG